ncbi:1503_t:CDS:2 [Entrophospora sp. SA101]|nr:1503_t:CDS:2 [Entrophospora sp. SA101]
MASIAVETSRLAQALIRYCVENNVPVPRLDYGHGLPTSSASIQNHLHYVLGHLPTFLVFHGNSCWRHLRFKTYKQKAYREIVTNESPGTV